MSNGPHWRLVVRWFAVGLCASAAVLSWFAFRAIREWQGSSALLMQQRADEAADILLGALNRDMQGLQRRVLSSADWVTYLEESPYELSNLAAGAFARYPYPDSFFAVRGTPEPASLLFFTRSDRPPRWLAPAEAGRTLPVTVVSDSAMGARLAGATAEAVSGGRRFAVFEVNAAGTTYQVVVHLRYGGIYQERLVGVLGFMVDLKWARDHYFDELAQQVGRTAQAPRGVTVSIADDAGRLVGATQHGLAEGAISRRTFRVMFFDPLLVAVTPSDGNSTWPQWEIRAVAAPDPQLAAAISGADRTVLIAALAALTLAFGVVLVAFGVSRLEAVSALRAEFVATVTHELKTPIAAIRAAGDTLAAGRISAPEEQRAYARMVVEDSKRLTRLVDNLLAMSRVTDLTQIYWFEPIEVLSVVTATLVDFSEPLRMAGCEARVEVPPDLPPIRADRRAIRLVLDNLVDNAIRYSPAGGVITLAARAAERVVTLTVSDRGYGIPAHQIERVTEKFFRGDHAANGTGLGLAIVKRVIDDHGGTFRIRSAANAGTTVEVSLPMAPPR